MEDDEEDWAPPGFIEEDDVFVGDELDDDAGYYLQSPPAFLNIRLVFTTDGVSVYKPFSFIGSGEELVNRVRCSQVHLNHLIRVTTDSQFPALGSNLRYTHESPQGLKGKRVIEDDVRMIDKSETSCLECPSKVISNSHDEMRCDVRE